MKYDLEVGTTVQADPVSLWRAWTDMARFPQWDPREEETKLDGPFQTGTTGWTKQKGTPRSPITLTAVEPLRRWQVTTPLPAGMLVIDHCMQVFGPSSVKLTKHYRAVGPMAIAFHLFYGHKIRATMPESFAALAREAARVEQEGTHIDQR